MLLLLKPRAFSDDDTPIPPPNTGAGGSVHGVKHRNEPVFDFFTGRRVDIPYEEIDASIKEAEQVVTEEVDTEIPESVKFKKKGRRFSSFKEIPVVEFPKYEPYSKDPFGDLELEILKNNALEQISKLAKYHEEKTKNDEIVHSLAGEVAKEFLRRKKDKAIESDDEEVLAFLLARIV